MKQKKKQLSTNKRNGYWKVPYLQTRKMLDKRTGSNKNLNLIGGFRIKPLSKQKRLRSNTVKVACTSGPLRYLWSFGDPPPMNYPLKSSKGTVTKTTINPTQPLYKQAKSTTKKNKSQAQPSQ